MSLVVVSLNDLLSQLGLKRVTDILKTFKGFGFETSTPHDVEVFLHTKAIEFEKSYIASTYLVFNQDRELLGFFSLTNKPLLFSKSQFTALSKNKQKQFNKHGRRLDNGGHLVNAYLLGQLGKNYAIKDNPLTGGELLTLAYQKAKSAAQIINTRYLWLECENITKLITFYSTFGFSLIDQYTSVDGLKVMIIKISR